MSFSKSYKKTQPHQLHHNSSAKEMNTKQRKQQQEEDKSFKLWEVGLFKVLHQLKI